MLLKRRRFMFKIELTQQEAKKASKFASERKASVLTILIDDIAESSAIRQEIGSPVFDELKKIYHDDPFTKIITRNGTGKVIKSQCRSGEIIKHRGDGFLAIFSAPSIAVERALEFQEYLHHHGHEKMKIRIGISMGQVILDELIHKDVFGCHANWAARAEAMSDVGHILITRGVYENAVEWLPKNDPRFSWKRHGSYKLREKEQALELFEPYNSEITNPLDKIRGTYRPELPENFTPELSKKSTSKLQVEIWNEDRNRNISVVPKNRDISVVPKNSEFPLYKPGDKVSVCLKSSENAYVYILNIGPKGHITPLFPNKLCQDNDVKANEILRFPDEKADFDWELQEPFGRELIKVFATKTPADMDEWVKGTLFEKTDTRDIRVVSNSFKKMPPNQWAEASCSFVVSKPE